VNNQPAATVSCSSIYNNTHCCQ